MKDRNYFYWLLLLMLCVTIQVTFARHIRWFPDLSLIIVVFAGIFYGFKGGIPAGLVVGFLRGIFSAGTLAADILIFPAAGAVAALLARMLYRQSPVVQVAITAVSVFTVVLCQTMYLNFTHGNDLNALAVFLRRWPSVSVTVILSPAIFVALKKVPER